MVKLFNRYVPFFLFFRNQRQYCANQMANLQKIFVRHVKDEDLMKISFVYGSPFFPSREFNFLRSKQEKLECALKRMKFKVETAISTRLEKKKKRSKTEMFESDSEMMSLSFCIVRNGQKVESDVPNIVAWVQGSHLLINDTSYDIEENAPVVSYISLPKNIMAGFPVYPKICLEFSGKEDSNFRWYRLLTKSEKDLYSEELLNVGEKGTYWLKVGEGFFYMTSQEDTGHKLKVVCVPKLGTRSGKEEEVISLCPVTYGPGKCPFEDRHKYTEHLTENGSIRCISYNILADLYADSDTARNDLFHYCPVEFLDYEYRKQLYLKEILGYNGDLLCLQEVDRKVFQNDLAPLLSTSGLEGVYSEKGRQVAEGLACFFRANKFRLIYSEAIILSEVVGTNLLFQDIWYKILENENLKGRILNRTTALQVVLLECLDEPNKKILLGNTHLFFHPASDNIRVIQATMCIRYLEDFVQKFQKENPLSTIALVFSGDFNSCPEYGVFQLLTTGNLPDNCADWQSNPEEAVNGLPLIHSFSLGSACGTPQYTNYTEGFHGCLDYIFYDKNFLTVQEIVPFPTHEQVTEFVALPNKVFPSDHLALVCTLKWL